MVRENAAFAPKRSPVLDRLKELSSTEIMTGVLVFLRDKKFPEQALYELFKEIGSDEDLGPRFRVIGPPGHLRSEPLRRILDHMEIGKILEVPLPNPVDQFYRLRLAQSKAVEEDLRDRGVLPDHEGELKHLAHRFSEIIDRTTQQPKTQTRS
jgi:hypothetical protein